MLLLLVIALVGWCANASCFHVTYNSTDQAELYFQDFMSQYDKHYSNKDELQMRFEIFKDNLMVANQLNKRSSSAVFGITKFMDLTKDEFQSMFTGLKESKNVGDFCTLKRDSDVLNVTTPISYDWRKQNVVTEVKDQGKCGSCWAFSSTGNIEGQYAIKHGKLQELSEQQLVDCALFTWGCAGGDMASTFLTLMYGGGLEGENDYPYTAHDDKCKFDESRVKAKLVGCYSYNLTSEDKLKTLVYQTGPISIAIQADYLHVYKGGIINTQNCNQGKVNHAVLLVGYGVEGNQPYWIIKNSWGKNWGEQGYLRIERKGANTCTLMNAMMATSVVA